MKLQFLGATETVTGSKYLVESGGRRVLVDCGLFQGTKRLRQRNWAPFPVSPREIDAVLLTHAHIDHTGVLPILVRDGFRGPVLCTAATLDLCRILLPDSAYLQEEEARFANRHGLSKHHPALPLYTGEDAARALEQLEPIAIEQDITLPGGMTARFGRAGHILGATWIHLRSAEGPTVLFSGDLGRPNAPVIPAPSPPMPADFLVVESTYGDRVHAEDGAAEDLVMRVSRTAARGGVVIIPAFAVGRTQSILHLLAEAMHEGRVPRVPVFVDSPMAIDVTELLEKHAADHRLTKQDMQVMASVARMTNSVEESKAIDARRGPMVIISASGMATGGRVLHHIKHFAPDHRNLILFAGYQAAGTRGADMVGGANAVKIHGAYVPVNAEVAALDGLSAHADWTEIVQWLEALDAPPRRVFLTHGEPAAADALRRRIEERFGWKAEVPEYLETVTLESNTAFRERR